ncbi:MAG: amidohydrolase family protein, partial [Candidatus Bathyarchaeia archaeon]
MYDYLLKNGFVVDGTGAPWFCADVAVKEGKIAEICKGIPASSADHVINVKGLVVAPGFFDMHAHSEMVYFSHPRAEAKIMQGVTTEFNCQCGSSCFPVKGLVATQIRRRVGGDFQVDWTDLNGYIRRLEAQGVSINSATQVGFGTVRIAVLGYENRAPTRD